jgi:probable rRNA maturation factor
MLKFDFNDKNKLVNKNIFLPNFKKIAKNVSDLLKIKDELTFEVTFVDNKEIKNLNKVYRGKNKATDVISFALLDNEEIKTNLIGEIYICVPFAKAESKKHN